MKTARTMVVIGLACWLAGCVVRAKQPAANNIPPAPQPAPKTEPAPPAGPLSIDQTQVDLPPPQPVNAEAAAAAQAADETAAAPAAAPRTGGTGRRTNPAPTPPTTPRPETPAPATPPAAAPPTPQPTVETGPRIQEIVPPTEQKRLQDLADGRKKETRQLLEQAASRRLNHREAGLKKTIESYLKLSDQAEGKGDMRQASDLAERALTLARDLQSGR